MKKVLEYCVNLWYSIFRIRDNKGVISMDKTNIMNVAVFFLNIVDRDAGSTITPLKLQKILYYSQGYYLAMNNKELFKEEFQAWAHGPANPKIYDSYKKYGCNAIDKPAVKDVPNFGTNIQEFLYDIWNTFGIYDGKYLEELTHQEEPWINARKGYEPGEICNNIITKESMKKFFKEKLNESNS